MSQERLAALVGGTTTTATIGKLETGKMNLTLDWMRKIARALDVKAADLLVDEDVPYRLSARELGLVKLFQELNDIGRRRFLRIANAVAHPVTRNDRETA